MPPSRVDTFFGQSGKQERSHRCFQLPQLRRDESGQTIVDSSRVPKIVTVVGNTTQSVTQSKFGGKSIYFDGTGDWLTLPAINGDQGPGDFTVDFWINFDVVGGAFFSQYQSGTAMQLFYLNGTDLSYQYTVGGAAKASFKCTWVPSTGVWYHVALVRSGANGYIFINGVSQALTITTAFNGDLSGVSALLYIAAYDGSWRLTGYIDEFRITKGVARWTANFIPPSAAYSPPAVKTVNGLAIAYVKTWNGLA